MISSFQNRLTTALFSVVPMSALPSTRRSLVVSRRQVSDGRDRFAASPFRTTGRVAPSSGGTRPLRNFLRPTIDVSNTSRVFGLGARELHIDRAQTCRSALSLEHCAEVA